MGFLIYIYLLFKMPFNYSTGFQECSCCFRRGEEPAHSKPMAAEDWYELELGVLLLWQGFLFILINCP